MANSNLIEGPGGFPYFFSLKLRLCATEQQEVGFKVSPKSLKQGQLIHYLASVTRRWPFKPDAF